MTGTGGALDRPSSMRLSSVPLAPRLFGALAMIVHLAGCDKPARDDTSPASPTEAPQHLPTAKPSPSPTAPSSRDPAVVLEAWRRALETHDWSAARAIWGDHGAMSGMSEAQFARAWGKYAIIDITPGQGDVEGAAGSLYDEVPVSITGLTTGNKPYSLSGTVTLRRVNDVDGATPEQLRSHIERSTLQP